MEFSVSAQIDAASTNWRLTLADTVDVTGSGTLGTIACEITGGGFTKTGSGTLVLTGTNTYTGNTAINGGTLRVAGNGSLGNSSSTLSFNDGTLEVTSGNSLSTSRAISLNGDATFNATNPMTLSGDITGSGDIYKSGSQRVALYGNNTFSGNVVLSAGLLDIDSDSFGPSPNSLFFNGGTIGLAVAAQVDNDIVLNASDAPFNVTNLATLTGVISGTGRLVKTGSNQLVLSGNNTYSGGTTVSAGFLQGTTTSVKGAIINNAEVEFSQNDDGFYTGTMSGTGKLSKTGTGTLTLLSSFNSYTGGTLIREGTINADVIGANNTNGPLGRDGITLGSTTTNGTLKYTGQTASTNRTVFLSSGGGTINVSQGSTQLTLTGALSGSGGTGSLTKTGPGTLILAQSSGSYGSGTTISEGVLSTSSFGNLGSTNAPLMLNGGTLRITGGGSTGKSTTLTGTDSKLDTAGSNVVMSGVISGSGALTKLGTSMLTLQGLNTFSGGFKLDSGTLALGSGSDSPVTNGPVGTGTLTINGGTVQAADSTARSVLNPVTVGGDFTIGGSGVLTLGDVTLGAANRTITVNQQAKMGTVGGSAGLTKAGSSALEATHVRIGTGALTVSAGTLTMSSSGAGENYGYDGTSVMGSLSVTTGAGGGKLDLTNNGMVITDDSFNVDNLRSWIIAGRGTAGAQFGRWDGATGVTSSTAQGVATLNNEPCSVGYLVDNAHGLINMAGWFMGQSIENGDVGVRYTRNGDANLDGVVNNNDITLLAGFYQPGTVGRHWYHADFNYDGEVNNNDITILSGFYAPGAAPLGPPHDPGEQGLMAGGGGEEMMMAGGGEGPVLGDDTEWNVWDYKWMSGRFGEEFADAWFEGLAYWGRMEPGSEGTAGLAVVPEAGSVGIIGFVLGAVGMRRKRGMQKSE